MRINSTITISHHCFLLLLTFTVGILLRTLFLTHIPGLNADEAWYGNFVLDLHRGAVENFSTPSGGSIFNPYFRLPLYFLHSYFEPSILILRLPAVISGVLLMLFSYILMKRSFNREIARLILIFTAFMPVNIMYSRIGWDASQIALFSLLIIFFSLRGRAIWTSFFLSTSLLIHPTCIFLLPIALLCNIAAVLENKDAVKIKHFLLIILAIIIIPLTTLYIINDIVYATLDHNSADIYKRLFDFSYLMRCWQAYIHFLTGTTSYSYFVGFEDNYISNLLFLILGGLIIFLYAYGLIRYIKNKNYIKLALLIGVFFSILIFSFIMGDIGYKKGYERYALFMVIPSIISFVVILNDLFLKKIYYSHIIMTMLICFFLYEISVNYYIKLFESGGYSEMTYRTNYRDPKREVFDLIKRDAVDKKNIDIYVSSWWNSEPLKYFFYNYESVNVLLKFDSISSSDPEIDSTSYIVTFPNDEMDQFVENRLLNVIIKKWKISDYGGKPVIYLYKI